MEYKIRHLDPVKGVQTLLLFADSKEKALQEARRQGIRPLSVSAGTGFRPGFFRKPDFQLGLFSQELLTLLESGLSLVESIETLNEKESRPARKEILGRLVASLHRGSSFSGALAEFPATFPSLFVATVRASEQTGGLEQSLAKYIAYRSQIDVVKQKVISASIYPAVLAVVGSAVIAFLMGYVVPRFSKIFEDLGGDLPWMSRWLIAWGNVARDNGFLLLLLGLAAVAALVYWLSRPATAGQVLAWLRRMPSLDEKIHVYELARFYRSLSMLLRGGMPIMPSLELVSGLLDPGLHARLTRAKGAIREGSSISTAMERFGLTTSVSVRMLRVGERTGQMGEMMERIAAFHDAEISQWIDWFVKLFEPILMTVIGVIIGFIVVLMYFPIFELAGSIK